MRVPGNRVPAERPLRLGSSPFRRMCRPDPLAMSRFPPHCIDKAGTQRKPDPLVRRTALARNPSLQGSRDDILVREFLSPRIARIFQAARDAATAVADGNADETIPEGGLRRDETSSLAVLAHIIGDFGDEVPRRSIETGIRMPVVVTTRRDDLGKGRSNSIHRVIDFFQGNESALWIAYDLHFAQMCKTALPGEVHTSQVARNAALVETHELGGEAPSVSVSHERSESDQPCRGYLRQVRKIEFQRLYVGTFPELIEEGDQPIGGNVAGDVQGVNAQIAPWGCVVGIGRFGESAGG